MAVPSRINVVATASWVAGTGLTLIAGPQSATAGNTLIVAAGALASAGQTVTGLVDTAGNTYTKVDHVVEATDTYREEIWVATNILGHATNQVTVTWSAPVGYRGLVVVQYAGVAAVRPVDGSATGTGPAVASVTTGLLTTTQPDDLHVLIPRWGLGGTVTYPAGFSANVSGNSNVLIVERFVAGAPYVGTYTVTHSITANPKIALAVAFSPVPVGGERSEPFVWGPL